MAGQPSFRALRSPLYLPGSNARALEKARSLPSDAVIIDLEDATAMDAKPLARGQAAAALASGGYGGRPMVVRINGLETPWGEEDLAMVLASAADAVLLPKLRNAAHLATLLHRLQAAPPALRLWVMIETPEAVLDLPAIGRAGRATRLEALVLGTNDLAKDMRARPGPDRALFVPTMAQMVMTARAHGLVALDGVCNAISDAARLEAELEQAVAFGFDGKTLIHPSQIDAANRAFAPDAAALEKARAIIAAFARPEHAASAVIQLDGAMVERLHLEEAERLVGLAESIERLASR